MRIRCFTIYLFLHYTFIEIIMLIYTFLVISFAQYKESMICVISCSKFSDVVPAFTCASIGNLWSICLGVNILRLEWSEAFFSETWKTCAFNFYWKYFSIKSIRKPFFTFRTSFFCCFFSVFFGFTFLLKINISTNKSPSSSSASFVVIVLL